MSRTTTEIQTGSWRQHFLLETDDGQYVPLVASDPRADRTTRARVFKLDSTWKAKGRALKVELISPSLSSLSRSASADPSSCSYLPQDTLAQTKGGLAYGYPGSELPRREPLSMGVAAIMRNQFLDQAAPCHRVSGEADKKEYCTYWIRHGECDYMQQGCRYKHEMPDLMTLRAIGFRHIPDWYKERMSRRPLRAHSNVLGSILNSSTNDAASDASSDDSDATLAEIPRLPATAPNTTPVRSAAVLAPTTFDLLTFDDEVDETPLPKVPNNTPEIIAYALPNLSPDRRGRFVPAGELPPMPTPPLQPPAASPAVEEKEEPKVFKQNYTPPTRTAPLFTEYFKEQKAAELQEKSTQIKKEDETPTSIPNSEPDKDAQIAQLQAKLAELAAAATAATTPSAQPKPVPAPRASRSPPAQPAATTAPGKTGLMASRHPDSDVQFQIKAQGRPRSAAKGRKLPAVHARKVVTTRTADNNSVLAKK